MHCTHLTIVQAQEEITLQHHVIDKIKSRNDKTVSPNLYVLNLDTFTGRDCPSTVVACGHVFTLLAI